MTFGHARHFVISHGCDIDEIKVMKINTPHFVTTSSSTSHMPPLIYEYNFLHIGSKVIFYDL
jgi:hypothetical protein